MPNSLVFMKHNWGKILVSFSLSISITMGIDSLGSCGVTLSENGHLFMRGSIRVFLVHCSICIISFDAISMSCEAVPIIWEWSQGENNHKVSKTRRTKKRQYMFKGSISYMPSLWSSINDIPGRDVGEAKFTSQQLDSSPHNRWLHGEIKESCTPCYWCQRGRKFMEYLWWLV